MYIFSNAGTTAQWTCSLCCWNLDVYRHREEPGFIKSDWSREPKRSQRSLRNVIKAFPVFDLHSKLRFSQHPFRACLKWNFLQFQKTYLVTQVLRLEDPNETYLGCKQAVLFYADDPNNDPNVSGDPYKTLFVARLVSCPIYFVILLWLIFILLTSWPVWCFLLAELWDKWKQDQKGIWGLRAYQAGRL